MSHAQGVADIRFLAARFRGLLDTADKLETLDSLETAIAEAGTKLAAANAETAAVKAKHAETLAAADIAASVKQRDADQVVTMAKGRADSILADAQKEAAALITNVRSDVEALMRRQEELHSTIAAHNTRIEELLADVAKHEQTTAKAKAGADEATAQLEKARGDLAKFREALAL